MKPVFRTAFLMCVSAGGAQWIATHLVAQQASTGAAEALPSWAYSVSPPSLPPSASPAAVSRSAEEPLLHLDGSQAAYTARQIASLSTVPDWFPAGHPAMPEVVAHGRKPLVGACGHCHLPTGMGRPENQSVAGLPAEYMLQQVEDFRSGARRSSDPRMASVNNMILASKNATPEEIREGVAYFASLKPYPWIRVIETDRVPLTAIRSLMMVVTDPARTEPIGDRVIEVSEDQERTELRDPRSGFIAYVPTGTLRRGEALVRHGGTGHTIACTQCHGNDLRGVGNVPSIAGRSPSQMTRQLIDFQRGARGGPDALPMKAPVAKLTVPEMVAITGYLASLKP